MAILVLLVLVLYCTAPLVVAVQPSSPMYHVYEVVAQASGQPAYTNPFTVPFNVTVCPPSGSGRAPLVVPGFFDGGKTWRARFACDTAGAWNWTAQAVDTGLSSAYEPRLLLTMIIPSAVSPRGGKPHAGQVHSTNFVNTLCLTSTIPTCVRVADLRSGSCADASGSVMCVVNTDDVIHGPLGIDKANPHHFMYGCHCCTHSYAK